jgi:hypothetical protein
MQGSGSKAETITQLTPNAIRKIAENDSQGEEYVLQLIKIRFFDEQETKKNIRCR